MRLLASLLSKQTEIRSFYCIDRHVVLHLFDKLLYTLSKLKKMLILDKINSNSLNTKDSFQTIF